MQVFKVSMGEIILADLNDVLVNGGILKIKGTTVFIDCPTNLNYYTSATGYYIVSAQGWKVYFKCRERQRAQSVCNELFGSGRYTVNSKV